jgi:chromosomal replication initiator protein
VRLDETTVAMNRSLPYENPEQIWEKVKASLSRHVPAHSFRMWIEPLNIEAIDDDVLRLKCPNLFFRKRILDNFSELIRTELQNQIGQLLDVDLVIADPLENSASPVHPPEQLPLPSMTFQPHGGRLLRQDYTFEQFVVGKNNDFAYSAALALAARKNVQQSALFLLSKTGMGKSHLSQAIGHHILSQTPSERVYYMTAEDFTNEMVSSYKSNCINDFKDKYSKGCDVLLLEDVHYLGGKERTQIELTHTLDSLFNENKKIIFSSCYSPSEIPKLSDTLRSRLTSGLISSIDPPDYRMRMKILKKYAQVNLWNIPTEIMELLATELTQDVRQLKSGLAGVTTRSSLMGCQVDLELAGTVIKNMVHQSRSITIKTIIQMVCKYYNLTPKELVSRSRKQAVVRPRQVAIYLSRRYTDQPLQVIGKSFNRYHATALHAIGVIEKGMRQSSTIQGQIEYFRQKLESGDF